MVYIESFSQINNILEMKAFKLLLTRENKPNDNVIVVKPRVSILTEKYVRSVRIHCFSEQQISYMKGTSTCQTASK